MLDGMAAVAAVVVPQTLVRSRRPNRPSADCRTIRRSMANSSCEAQASAFERLQQRMRHRGTTAHPDPPHQGAAHGNSAVCDPGPDHSGPGDLLGNALAACDRHGHVTLSVHSEPSPGHHVIVRGVARAHGADITAESDGLGKGATFTLRLPQDAQ